MRNLKGQVEGVDNVLYFINFKQKRKTNDWPPTTGWLVKTTYTVDNRRIVLVVPNSACELVRSVFNIRQLVTTNCRMLLAALQLRSNSRMLPVWQWGHTANRVLLFFSYSNSLQLRSKSRTLPGVWQWGYTANRVVLFFSYSNSLQLRSKSRTLPVWQ